MKNLFYIALFVLFANTGYCEQLPKAKVYILVYHSFYGNDKILTDFSEEQLREQLVLLKENGYKFVLFSDIVDNKISGNKNILITIDDGNETVYKVYGNILKPLGIKPLLGIYPAIINRQKYAMTWEQLRELLNDGCEIASHGYFHMRMIDSYQEKNTEAFLDEIYKSKKVLEKKLNMQITIMIYPFGQRSKITIDNLKMAGYKYGLTIAGGGINLPLDDSDKKYEIPRYLLTNKNYKGIFQKIFENSK